MAGQARAPATVAPTIVWRPSATQRALLACPVTEVFFGGSRGGGKTDGMLGDWAQHAATHGEHAIGLMVRRTSVQLGETFERARVIYTPLGASFFMQPARIRMANGARLNFAHLDNDADADQYMGQSNTRVYVEEAGNFPSPAPILKLMATLRSGSGVPCRIRLTGNPGGPGHQWLRARYIDPAPPWTVIADKQTGLERVFIPSRVGDNPHLGGEYVDMLRQSGSPELVRAWLDGDWDAVAGAFFPEFRTDLHVVAPRTLPAYWTRFRAMDWGSAKPFCVQWFAVSDGELPEFPRGALVMYREWYGSAGEPNVGMRLTAEEVADGIRTREAGDLRGDLQMSGVADPAMFAEDGGPSHAQRMAERDVHFRPADNRRVAGRGAMGGWDQVRARLKGDGDAPGLFIFSTCRDVIRTLPAMQHDPNRPEDMDSRGDDHAADCLRYGAMSRPYETPRPDAGRDADRYRRARRARPGGAWAA